MTTKEKLAASEAKKANHKITPREPPMEAKRKPKSLLPPGEAFRVTKPNSADKKSTRPEKPMTTKEKQRAAEAAKKAEGGVQPKTQAKDAGKSGGKVRNTKPPDMFSVLKSHDASIYRFVSKNGRPSVVVRPTEKAKWLREKLAAAAKQSSSKTSKTNNEKVESGAFRIMDLPEELRVQIWKLRVVDPDFVVCPALPTGREQPDLATVSKKVREEVLPIYYRFNTFGIELSPREMPKVKAKGLVAIGKWGARLEEKGWFGMIRKWAFDFTPSMGTGIMRKKGEDKSLVISMIFTEDENGSWKGVGEVHRDAQCILPGSLEYDKCIIETSPAWLAKLVNGVADAAKGGNIHGRMITELAKAIKAQENELSDIRCKKTGRSIESDSGVECV